MVESENLTLDIGIVKIHLPDAINPSFIIAQSLVIFTIQSLCSYGIFFPFIFKDKIWF